MSTKLHELGKVKVGVECAILYKNEILLQRRLNDTGFYPNMLTLPGGHVDGGEDVLTACIREVEEETGISIDPNRTELITNSVNFHKDRGVVWVIYAFRTKLEEREKVLSSDEGKCDWYDLNTLNKNEVIPPVLEYLDVILTSKKIVFSSGIFEKGCRVE